MPARLLLLLTVVPLVELYLLFSLGSAIGFWPTLGMVILTAVLGATFAKAEGMRVVRAWQTALSEGRVPEEGVVSGLLVVAAGVLLIAPGVLTDFAGLLLMIAPVRRYVARWLEGYARKHIEASAAGQPSPFVFRVGGMPMGGFPGGVRMGGVPRGRRAPVGVVEVTGEVIEERRPDVAPRKEPLPVLEGEIVDE